MKKNIYLILALLLSTATLSVNGSEKKSAAPSPVFQAKDYTSLIGRVKGLSEGLLKMHFTLYNGYVKNTNKLLEALNEMRENNQESSLAFGALKRRFGWEYNGMRLHELYFGNLGSNNRLSPKSPLYKQIEKDFGSYNKWRADFISTGLIRGIGWVILCKDPIDSHLFNVWINEHDVGNLSGGTPLLVMDVWEHAYITEFGLNRAKYIDVFLGDVDWVVVEKRLSDSANHSTYTVSSDPTEAKKAS